MITTLKLAGLSAILSAGVVAGYPGQDQQPAPAAGKIFYDRVFDAASSDPVIPASLNDRPVRIEVNTAAKSDRLQGGNEAVSRTTEMRISASTSALVRETGPRALAATR